MNLLIFITRAFSIVLYYILLLYYPDTFASRGSPRFLHKHDLNIPNFPAYYLKQIIYGGCWSTGVSDESRSCRSVHWSFQSVYRRNKLHICDCDLLNPESWIPRNCTVITVVLSVLRDGARSLFTSSACKPQHELCSDDDVTAVRHRHSPIVQLCSFSIMCHVRDHYSRAESCRFARQIFPWRDICR